MPQPGWTLDLAREWVAPARVRWRRWGLLVATVLAFAASVAGEGDRPCSVDDPTVCGPDPVFSVAMALLGASVALLWWRPWVAAGCAVVFAALDLAFDDVWAARLVWPVVAALHVAHVWSLHREGEAQVRLARRAASPVPPSWRRPVPGAAAAGSALPLAAAAVLGVVVLASLAALARAEAGDRAHLARSVVVTATVTGWEDDDLLRVRVDRPPAGVPSALSLDSLADHAAGDAVRVRVDPTDVGWSHLEAEPPDPTWWLTVATASGLLALLLVAGVVAGRMRRQALAQDPPAEGVAVRYALDEAGTAVLVLPHDDVVVGFVDLLLPPGTPRADAGSLEPMADTLRAAALVGAVRPGGWCALATPEGLLLPEGTLGAAADLPSVAQVENDLDAEDPRSWSDPVPEVAVPAVLPVVLGPSAADRAVGAAAALAAVALVTWMLGWDEGSWFQGLVLVGASLQVVHWGVDRALRQVSADGEALHTVSALRREDVPMWAVEEVRCTPTHVVLTLGADADGLPGPEGDSEGELAGDVLELGPFPGSGRHADGGGARERGRRNPSSPTAPEVAAALDSARLVRSAARGLGEALDRPRRRVGPGVPWLAVAAVVVVGQYLWVVVR